MEQHATAKLLRPVLRLLLLAGAATVWWLLFSGGAAHADNGEHAVPAVHLSPVATAVDHAADTALDRTTATTESLPAPLPSVGKVTATVIHSTVDTTSTRLTGVLEKATDTVQAAVVPQTSDDRPEPSPVAETPAPTHESAPAAHAVRPHAQHRDLAPDRPVEHRHATQVVPTGTTSTSAVQPVDQPAGDTPAAPEPPVAPGSTTTPSASGAAYLAVLPLVVPALLQRVRARTSAVLPGGPAFPPDNSPD